MVKQVAAEVHAPPSTPTPFEDISDPEDGPDDENHYKPSMEGYPSIGDELNIFEWGSPPKEGLTEKPMTKVQVWEKKLIEIEPSFSEVVASALQIPNRVKAQKQAFCEDFKGGLVSALERHQDRLQDSLNRSLKDSELLKKAVQNIFLYAEKLSEAFHEEQRRLIENFKYTKTFLTNAVRSDSEDLLNKNAGGDVLRCWGTSKQSHTDDPV
ncbi:uncharacterized protein [Diabrotica undecimpunctata]|uniref:uncharacterized protein n=1 Tax=Diabrotica undecimpunctata TaxID=50387 RepID=UPI003B6411ED